MVKFQEKHSGARGSQAIGMSNAAASGRIEEDYAGSRPYQHAMEIIRNATQQNGTTYVCSDIVVPPATDALKRAFINYGPALTKSELDSYMTMTTNHRQDVDAGTHRQRC
jgi:hypothetical protein